MRPLHRVYVLLVAAAILVAAPGAPSAFQTVDEIVARNLEARGGVEKLRSLNTVKFTGKVSIQAQPGQFGAPKEPLPITTWTKRPNLFRRDTTFPDRIASVAFDGTTVWSLDSTVGTPQPVTGPQAEQTRGESFDPLFLDYKAKGHRIELVGPDVIDGIKVHHLRITRKNGRVESQYLDTATGLEMRTVTVLENAGRKAEIRQDLSDYREVDGMRVPFLMRQFLDGRQVLQVQLESVEFNTPMSDEVFSLTK